MNSLLAERILPTGQTIQLLQGDITTERADAIVNAANGHLQHGGGVARAIAAAGGDVIRRESDEWVRVHGPVSHARPARTSAGRLPARVVIHAVGPVWGEGDEDAKLGAAVRGSLSVADELQLESLSLPAISTGIFGFPKERAAGILFRTLEEYFPEHKNSAIKLVKLVVYDRPTVDAFVKAWNEARGQ